MPENKPRRPPGIYCPLWRKDVSKVCHTCDWWQSLPVQDRANPAAVMEQWSCALVLSVIAQRSMHAAIDGVQAATESFRNLVAERCNTSEIARRAALDVLAGGVFSETKQIENFDG